MAIIVEHDKRKSEILAKALDVFVKEGYENVTFQKIADRCMITRTTLYIYFKNKREIFLWSIKQLTEGLEKDLIEIVRDENLNSEQCLRKILDNIVDSISANKELFYVVLTYLLGLRKKHGENIAERVQRRVIRLRHLLTAVIVRGQKEGAFKDTAVKSINEMFYSLLEAAMFRIAVLADSDLSKVRDNLNIAVDSILKNA